jgi:uracil-DNA glycosylase
MTFIERAVIARPIDVSKKEMATKTAESAAPFVPETRRLPILAQAVQRCRGCDLYKDATQAVFGEGPTSARLVLIGEQPGDQEDKQGKPFVGPSGHMLDRALAEAGIDRDDVYVTNAVKHFRFALQGRFRLHKKPSAGQIHACRPWLEAEIEVLHPELLICLGATAVTSVFERPATITSLRGRIIAHPMAKHGVIVTVHPSSLLRARDETQKRLQYDAFVKDLRQASRYLN